MFLDQTECVLDDIERGEPEKIHFEEGQFLQAHHVVFGDDFVFVGLVKRDQIFERDRGNYHAGRVHAAVARHPLNFLRNLQHLGDARIFGGQFGDGRLPGDGVLQLDVEREGDQFGDAINVRKGNFEGPAHVLDGGTGAQRSKSDDLGHLFAPILFRNVLNHFAAAAGVKIDVDIGHTDALRIQEAFEQQAVLKGIDIGDLHGVAD